MISHSSGKSGTLAWKIAFSRGKLHVWPVYFVCPPRICHNWTNAWTGDISISSIWVSTGRCAGGPGPGYILFECCHLSLFLYLSHTPFTVFKSNQLSWHDPHDSREMFINFSLQWCNRILSSGDIADIGSSGGAGSGSGIGPGGGFCPRRAFSCACAAACALCACSSAHKRALCVRLFSRQEKQTEKGSGPKIFVWIQWVPLVHHSKFALLGWTWRANSPRIAVWRREPPVFAAGRWEPAVLTAAEWREPPITRAGFCRGILAGTGFTLICTLSATTGACHWINWPSWESGPTFCGIAWKGRLSAGGTTGSTFIPNGSSPIWGFTDAAGNLGSSPANSWFWKASPAFWNTGWGIASPSWWGRPLWLRLWRRSSVPVIFCRRTARSRARSAVRLRSGVTGMWSLISAVRFGTHTRRKHSYMENTEKKPTDGVWIDQKFDYNI